MQFMLTTSIHVIVCVLHSGRGGMKASTFNGFIWELREWLLWGFTIVDNVKQCLSRVIITLQCSNNSSVSISRVFTKCRLLQNMITLWTKTLKMNNWGSKLIYVALTWQRDRYILIFNCSFLGFSFITWSYFVQVCAFLLIYNLLPTWG